MFNFDGENSFIGLSRATCGRKLGKCINISMFATNYALLNSAYRANISLSKSLIVTWYTLS